MKKFLILTFGLVLLSCSHDPNSLIKHLDGYWEIDEVTMADGTKREYTYNDTVDYFSITDSLTGFRKKMKPNFNGTYTTSDDSEELELKIENDSLHIYYTTPFANWKETVLEATEEKLLIINDQKTKYLYKRFEPITVEKSISLSAEKPTKTIIQNGKT
ncbi:lipocalin family protein [Gelidibacter maritimus]|uniref:Lipocalin-like domain-containing protein n=1 Tax=Gelidibacter maritimus TaxID=2761487 RepID=A0A7W2M7N1_9FLAO|nr:lipocalin family protein [Gelidibacter maritimus]MBA6154252.1 hypothetical protein [Gelidibacter maritimus]